MSTERVERFSAGESFTVDPDAIERELASLWREAGSASSEGRPVTRACLWNVVVHVEERPEREGASEHAALLRLMEELPLHLAYRGLMLHTHPEDTERAPLESWISARCIPAGDGGKLVCSEEITLSAHGRGDRHLPGLVRALIAPGVPTAVVFGATPDLSDPVTKRLVELADRIVVHTDRTPRPNLSEVQALLARTPGFGMDMSWLEHADLRQEVAALFDSPGASDHWMQLDEVEYIAPPKRRASARLMLGWIAHAFGGRDITQKSTYDGQVWQATRRNGTPFRLILTEDSGVKEPSIRFRNQTDGTSMSVSCRSGRIDSVASGGDAQTLPRLRKTPEVLLSRALASRSQDEVFGLALTIGSQL